MSKSITVNLAGQGKSLKLDVTPEMTMEDTLRHLGLSTRETDIASPDGSRLVALQEKPWDLVQSPSDSITVSPSAQVGNVAK